MDRSRGWGKVARVLGMMDPITTTALSVASPPPLPHANLPPTAEILPEKGDAERGWAYFVSISAFETARFFVFVSELVILR